ncbi:MAG: hypothetical protein AAGH67_13395 [Cyanobacteria bacterium P01_H01_bin.162]
MDRQLARLIGPHPAFGTPPERGFEAQSAGKGVTYFDPELRLGTVSQTTLTWTALVCPVEPTSPQPLAHQTNCLPGFDRVSPRRSGRYFWRNYLIHDGRSPAQESIS